MGREIKFWGCEKFGLTNQIQVFVNISKKLEVSLKMNLFLLHFRDNTRPITRGAPLEKFFPLGKMCWT